MKWWFSVFLLFLLTFPIGKCGRGEENWTETTVYVGTDGVYNRYLASTKSYLIVPPAAFSSPVHVYVKTLGLPKVRPQKSLNGYYYVPVGYYEVVGVERGVEVKKSFYLRVPCGNLPEKYGEVHVYLSVSGEWKLVGRGFVESNGYVAFSMPDFGEFLVLVEEKPAEFWVEEEKKEELSLPATGGVVSGGGVEFFVPAGAVPEDVPLDVVPQSEISLPDTGAKEVVLKLGLVPVGVRNLDLIHPVLVAYPLPKKFSNGSFQLWEVKGGKLEEIQEPVGYDPVTGYVFFEIKHFSLYAVLFSRSGES